MIESDTRRKAERASLPSRTRNGIPYMVLTMFLAVISSERRKVAVEGFELYRKTNASDMPYMTRIRKMTQVLVDMRRCLCFASFAVITLSKKGALIGRASARFVQKRPNQLLRKWPILKPPLVAIKYILEGLRKLRVYASS